MVRCEADARLSIKAGGARQHPVERCVQAPGVNYACVGARPGGARRQSLDKL